MTPKASHGGEDFDFDYQLFPSPVTFVALSIALDYESIVATFPASPVGDGLTIFFTQTMTVSNIN